MKKLEEITTFMWDRLSEKSSWYGVLCLVLDAVMIITPDSVDLIINSHVIPILGAVIFLTPDKKKIGGMIENLNLKCLKKKNK